MTDLRAELEQTQSLEEAVKLLFRKNTNGRTQILPEAMQEDQAMPYVHLAQQSRVQTYEHIAKEISKLNEKQTSLIIDVGCGSGALSLALAQKNPQSTIYAFDPSSTMIKEGMRYSNDHKIIFARHDAYTLEELGLKADLVVCRNVLHRMKDAQRGIQAMLSSVKPGGTLYIRDLKREADWSTVVKRIGDARWKFPQLVLDYVGAMANMFTMEEIRETFKGMPVRNIEVREGYYAHDKGAENKALPEFASQVEYVCTAQKD